MKPINPDHRIIVFDRPLYDNVLMALDYLAQDMQDGGHPDEAAMLRGSKSTVISQWDKKLNVYDTMRAVKGE